MTEEKTRIHTRISPDTRHKMEATFPRANCLNQNEFEVKKTTEVSNSRMCCGSMTTAGSIEADAIGAP